MYLNFSAILSGRCGSVVARERDSGYQRSGFDPGLRSSFFLIETLSRQRPFTKGKFALATTFWFDSFIIFPFFLALVIKATTCFDTLTRISMVAVHCSSLYVLRYTGTPRPRLYSQHVTSHIEIARKTALPK